MSDLPARESMEFDVVVVGAGPAGLATAIRLKQKAAEAGTEISVVVVEKGSEVGAHILSGAVIDPIGLDGLLPEWRSDPDRPLKTEVTADEFMYLGHAGGVKMPNLFMPKLMNNHGNFVGSLGNVARYLGRKAEELGVEIYPGFPASEVLVEDGKVVGVATGDMGISRDGEPNANFTRGMELRAKYTIFGEGARGSLTKQMVERFGLNAGPRPPEIRHRHQGAVAGQAGALPARPRAPFHGLAAAQQCRRRLLALPFRRQSGLGRLRGPSQLQEPDPVALRRVPALQDASDGARRVRGRQAHRLRRAGDHGGRLAVGAAPVVPRRLPRRRLRRLRERAAHQGQPQRDPVGHALRRPRLRRPAGGPGQRRGRGLRGVLARLAHRLRPQAGAQREAALVALRHGGGRGARAASTCG